MACHVKESCKREKELLLEIIAGLEKAKEAVDDETPHCNDIEGRVSESGMPLSSGSDPDETADESVKEGTTGSPVTGAPGTEHMVPLGSSETPATEIKTLSHTATEKSATESPAAEMPATGSSDSSPIETSATGNSPTDRTKDVAGHGVTGPPATVALLFYYEIPICV